MYIALIAIAAVMLIVMLVRLVPKEKELDIDILNDYSELSRLEASGFADIRIFRRREISNLRLMNNVKLVPFGELNDVHEGRFQFTTVQDTALVVKAKDAKGNDITVKTYEYNQQNKEKALGLKRLIETRG
jgi:hypothetical protein